MNWKSIIATALVTGIVTLVTGMLLFWWQAKKPELVYRSVTSIPFVETNQSLYIQNIDIENTGETFVEDVVLQVTFSEGKIEKSRAQIDNTIPYTIDLLERSITLRISNLNENEKAKISLLLNSAGKDPIEPQISLRAKNVTGKPSGTNEMSKKLAIIISLASAYIGLFAALIVTRRGRLAISRLSRIVLYRDFSGEQRYTIASALAIQGLPDQAKEYLDSSAPRRYWVEADLLGARAIACADKDVQAKISQALSLLAKNEDIVDSSKAVINYNLARIHQVLGDSEKASSKLESARALDRRQVEMRLAIDPVFEDDLPTS